MILIFYDFSLGKISRGRGFHIAFHWGALESKEQEHKENSGPLGRW